jgi:hypothetical protein
MGIELLESWFDFVLVGLSALTVLLQVYAIVIQVKVSPKEMRVYRFFLCTCTVLFGGVDFWGKWKKF